MHHLGYDITPTCDSKCRKNSYQGVTSLAFICLTDNFTVEKYLGHHFPEAPVSVFLFLVNIRTCSSACSSGVFPADTTRQTEL